MEGTMKQAYLIGGVVAVVCVLIAVYYLIPGINHILASGDPTSRHLKHAVAFLALAVVALVGARFAANAESRV
jgi:hypothetical protein